MCKPPRNGLITATRLILRLKENSLVSAGLPCTSYVWVNAGTHGRTREAPLGFTRHKYVRDANVWLSCMKFCNPKLQTCPSPNLSQACVLRMTSRLAILLTLAAIRAIYWCIEQPHSSMVRFHPDIRQAGVHSEGFAKSFMRTRVGGFFPRSCDFLVPNTAADSCAGLTMV